MKAGAGLRIALAQINVTVGDLKGNEMKIADSLMKAKKLGADLAAFPELAVTGYPPEDLLFKPVFIRENLAAVRRLVRLTRGMSAVIGFADRDRSGLLYNAAAIAANGRWVSSYRKMMLPNYGVFDEKRYFAAGGQPLLLEFAGRRIGISICEDIWVKEGPVQAEARAGAGVLLNLSASPYNAGKLFLRERLLTHCARSTRSWICYLNLVGGQDELIFDGGSMLVNPQGRLVFRAPQFEEGIFLVEIPLVVPAQAGIPNGRTDLRPRSGRGQAFRGDDMTAPVEVIQIPWKSSRTKARFNRSAPPFTWDEEVFKALVLGTRDYVFKNGFSRVVIGLSGGIDSALTAAIAVAALGKEKVTGVSLPSRYSSLETQADARTTVRALGIQFLELSIEPIFQPALETLGAVFQGHSPDVTEENLQARIRGTLLMALSNKFHWLVLSTGNKSELSTGYCTLYGDMVGGFAVIKDLPKSWVYRIARTANRFFKKPVIPESIFRRPPTAELRPNQRDRDTLPPYGRLDRVVRAYVEEDRSAAEIQRLTKAPRKEIQRVLRMIDLSEYKRRQAPVGIKITPRAFGRDRRMPITNQFREE